MRTAFILCLAIVLFVVLIPIASSGQDQRETEQITVKAKEVNNGVVILGVHSGKGSFELRCNKGVSGCTVLDPGDYLMGRLPKNQGLYDCTDADVYRKVASPQDTDKLGQYCLLETN